MLPRWLYGYRYEKYMLEWEQGVRPLYQRIQLKLQRIPQSHPEGKKWKVPKVTPPAVK